LVRIESLESIWKILDGLSGRAENMTLRRSDKRPNPGRSGDNGKFQSDALSREVAGPPR
jgi:hypothetical protein